MTKFNLIAIDGELATGKTTISRLLAKQNNYILLSTGVLFRVIGKLIFENTVVREQMGLQELPDGFELTADWNHFFQNFQIDEISYLNYLNWSWLMQKFHLKEQENLIKGKCFGDAFAFNLPVIIDEKTSGKYAGILAKVMPIRNWIKAYCYKIIDDFMHHKIKDGQWIQFGICGAIMEGRDICWNMLSEAHFKFYLFCSLEAKKERRILDFQIQHHRLPNEIEENEMFTALEKRVKSDDRILQPSRELASVIKIDTSHLTIQEELQLIQDYIKK